MRSDDVWRRIRWGNVARLAALVALGLVAAAWPRLGGDPPRLPPAEPVPLGGGEAGGIGGADRPRAKGRSGERRKGGEEKRPRAGEQSGEGTRSRSQGPSGEGRKGGEGKRPRAQGQRSAEGPAGVANRGGAVWPGGAPVPTDPAAVEFGVP
jgi:hypothetical protein